MARLLRKKRIKKNKEINSNVDLSPVELLKKGFEKHQAGFLDEAKEIYLLIIESNPNEYNSLQLLGIIENDKQNYLKAIELMERSLSIKPSQPSVCNNLGNAYFSITKYEKAEDCYKNAIKIKPDYIEAYDNLGILYLETNKTAEAKKTYSKAIKLNSNYAPSYNNLGNICFNEGNFLEAEGYYLKSIKIKEDFFHPLYNLAKLYKETGKRQNAIKYYLKSIEIKPDASDAHYNLANLYRENNDNEKAILHYKKAKELNPKDDKILVNLGITLHHLEKDEEAKEIFKECLKYTKNNTVSFVLDVLEGRQLEHAPDDYISELFDGYANNFEKHLVKTLQYSSPEKISQILKKEKVNRLDNVLDLGCGTGLVGKEIKKSLFINNLVGVDLSTKMLEQAKEKKLYNELVKDNVINFLENNNKCWDLITAADVFIYVGRLDKLFNLMKQRIKKNGLLCFDFEIDSKEGFRLRRTGRFAHSFSYINQLAEKNSFFITKKQEAIIRHENDKPVYGQHVLCIRK